MKIKKTVIIAAVLAAVLSVTAVGCQGSADNSSAVATTSQNSAANVSDGNSLCRCYSRYSEEHQHV